MENNETKKVDALTLQEAKDQCAQQVNYPHFQAIMDDHEYEIAIEVADAAAELILKDYKEELQSLRSTLEDKEKEIERLKAETNKSTGTTLDHLKFK